MKRYLTMNKFNLTQDSYKDPIIPRINNIKSKIINNQLKENSFLYKNINSTNTISTKNSYNSDLKSNHLSLSYRNHKNKAVDKFKYKNLSNNKTYQKSFTKNSEVNSYKFISKKSFSFNNIKKRNYAENLNMKIKNIFTNGHDNDNDIEVFYDKENMILMKPFNFINNTIRKNINNAIIEKKGLSLYRNNSGINNNKKNNDINSKKIKIILRNNMIKYKKKKFIHFKNINNCDEKDKTHIYYYEPLEKSLSELYIKNKKLFNSINCRICFPYFINDKVLMNNYSINNFCKFKKWIDSY